LVEKVKYLEDKFPLMTQEAIIKALKSDLTNFLNMNTVTEFLSKKSTVSQSKVLLKSKTTKKVPMTIAAA
jgi:hypothetical protein